MSLFQELGWEFDMPVPCQKQELQGAVCWPKPSTFLTFQEAGCRFHVVQACVVRCYLMGSG